MGGFFLDRFGQMAANIMYDETKTLEEKIQEIEEMQAGTIQIGNGLQKIDDIYSVKLDGATLTNSSSGLKVTDNTYALVGHNHSGVYSLVAHTHSGVYEPANSNIQSHISSTSNPHSVTATQVGLSNLTNDAQVKKISSSTDNAIVRWDSTTGALVQNSLTTIDDSGSINIPSGQSYKINNVALTYTNVGAAASSHNHVKSEITGLLDSDTPTFAGIILNKSTANTDFIQCSEVSNIVHSIAETHTYIGSKCDFTNALFTADNTLGGVIGQANNVYINNVLTTAFNKEQIGLQNYVGILNSDNAHVQDYVYGERIYLMRRKGTINTFYGIQIDGDESTAGGTVWSPWAFSIEKAYMNMYSAGNFYLGSKTVGLGWNTSYRAIQTLENAFVDSGADRIGIYQNLTYDSALKYRTTGKGALYYMLDGEHYFDVSTSGTQYESANGNTSNAMKIDNSGNLIIKSAIMLKNDSGELKLRNAADAAYIDLRVKNLIVEGITTTVNSETVSIADNILQLNNNATDVPIEDGGIELYRGLSTAARIIWDETNDIWKAGLSGSEVAISLVGHNHSGVYEPVLTKGNLTEATSSVLTISSGTGS
jgi:hypothetical protein